MPELVSSAALHPTEDLVVAGGRNFYVYKYDLKTGEQLGTWLLCFPEAAY